MLAQAQILVSGELVLITKREGALVLPRYTLLTVAKRHHCTLHHEVRLLSGYIIVNTYVFEHVRI